MKVLDTVATMAPTIEEKWDILKQHAPEVYEFYESILSGGENYPWWEDKPLQVVNRFALYAGEIARQRDTALSISREEGRKERTVEIYNKAFELSEAVNDDPRVDLHIRHKWHPECFGEGDEK